MSEPKTNDTNDQKTPEVQGYSADSLMEVFSRSRLGISIVGAVVFHVVVIGALSIPMFFEDGKAEAKADDSPTEAEQIEQQAAEGGTQGKGDGEGAANGETGGTNGEGGANGDGDAEGNGAGEGDGDGEGEGDGEADMTPVEREVTEAADPEDIPDDPDDIDIDIDDMDL